MSTLHWRSSNKFKPGDHLCCLYETEAERQELLDSLVCEGLQRGEKTILLLDSSQDNRFLDDYGERNRNIQDRWANGQLSLLKVDTLGRQEGICDPEQVLAKLHTECDRVLSLGYPAVRIIVCIYWPLRGNPGPECLVEFEANLATKILHNRCMVFCLHDRSRLDPALLLEMIASHPIVVVRKVVYHNLYHLPPANLLEHSPPEAILQYWLNNLAEQKQAEGALEKQAQIIEQIHDAVVSTDLDGYVTSWNKGAQRLFGYSSREAIGQHISFAYPVEEHQFLQDEVIAPLRAKSVHEVEVRMLRKSGEVFFAHLSLSLLRDPHGEVVGMIGYSMDITDRKNTEAALQVTNRQMISILESISDAFYTLDHQWRFTYLNQKACQILRRSSGELLGKPIWELYPDLIDSVLYQAFHQAIEGHARTEFEIWYQPLDSWFEVRAYPYQDGLSVYFSDISERKRVQQELEIRARQQRVMADLGQQALANLPIQELMDEIASCVADTLQVEYCQILELLPGGKELLLRAGVGWQEGYVGHTRIDAGENSQAGYTLLTEKPVIVRDLGSETRFAGLSLLLDHGVVSGMSVIILEEGKPFGILGVHTRHRRIFTDEDIHFLQSASNLLALALERKRVEEYLAYQADLLANVRDAIIATDDRFTITAWNKAAEGLYGWKSDEMLGRPINEIFGEVEEFQDYWGIQMLQTLAESGRYQGEGLQYHKDGMPIYIESTSIAVRDAAGSLRGYVSVNRDVTERKQAELALRESEERFRQLSENIPDVFWMIDVDKDRVIYVSPAYEGIWGRTRQSVYDQPLAWMEAIHPDDLERVMAKFTMEHLIAGEYDVEYRILQPDGQLRWIHDRGSPIQNDHGKVYRIAGIAVDVTVQVLVEKQLRQLSRQIVSAQEKERQRVSRELHDEAGQALTALKIGLELVQSDLIDQPVSDPQSLNKAIGLVDQTMENIRSIAQQLRPPELDALGLSPVLEQLCRSYSQQTHIDVQYRAIELPEYPDSLAICFYRVAQEALTNVTKHAHAHHVQVELNYDAESFYLSVADDGQGFDKVSPDSPSQYRPGLGLLGMQERVELLGGSLEVNTQPGQGTRLVARIPRRKMA